MWEGLSGTQFLYITDFLLSQSSGDGWWLFEPTVRRFLGQLSPESSRLARKPSSAQLPAMMERCCSVPSSAVGTGHMWLLGTWRVASVTEKPKSCSV